MTHKFVTLPESTKIYKLPKTPPRNIDNKVDLSPIVYTFIYCHVCKACHFWVHPIQVQLLPLESPHSQQTSARPFL